MEKEKLYRFLTEDQEKFYRFAFRYVKEREAALDVVQEAVVSALQNYASLRQPEYMKTWFYRILINSAVNYLRKNKKYIPMEDVLAFSGEMEEDRLKDEKIDLNDAVDRLPTKYKTLVMLRYFEDMKLSDIALSCEMPESTVKTRLKSAVGMLSKMI